MKFDPGNGKQVLGAYAVGELGRDEALELLERIDWTTAVDSDRVFPPDNAWHLVDIVLNGTPGFAEFRAELVARVRRRRGLD